MISLAFFGNAYRVVGIEEIEHNFHTLFGVHCQTVIEAHLERFGAEVRVTVDIVDAAA